MAKFTVKVFPKQIVEDLIFSPGGCAVAVIYDGGNACKLIISKSWFIICQSRSLTPSFPFRKNKWVDDTKITNLKRRRVTVGR